MDVTPVYADSLGAKSFCVRVDTDETSVLIDPGAAPFPKDHPTMSEEDKAEALHRAWEAIEDAAEGVRHVAITHWHGDHFSMPDDGLDFGKLFGGRVLWVKDPREMINPGQQKKAHRFFEALQDTFGGGYTQGELPTPTGVTVRSGDEAQVVYEDATIRLSRPLPHGQKDGSQGYVLAVRVDEAGATHVHTSDVQGPGSKPALKWVLDQEPDTLTMDGPSTYLIGQYDVTQRSVEKAFDRAELILDRLDLDLAVYDHHLAREPGFRDRCPQLGEKGAETVADLKGYSASG